MGERFVRFLSRNKTAITLSFILLAIALGVIGITMMRINPDLTSLVPGNSPDYRMLVDFLKKKSSSNILIVVLDCGGMVEKGMKALRELSNRFKESGDIREVLRFDNPELFVKYGLFLEKPAEASRMVERLRKGFEKSSLTDFGLWRSIGNSYYMLLRFVEDYVRRKGFKEYVLVSPSKRLILMHFVLNVDITDVDATSKVIEKLRSIANEVEREYGFKIYFTGSPMSTYESQVQVKKDFTYTTIFSIAAISLLMYLTFGNMLSVVFVFISMLVAMAIALGIYYISFGEINIVTSFINAMVLGLGVDFGIHLSTKFTHHLKRFSSHEKAMVAALEETFVPSLVSALTTVSAFLTMLFSEFHAFSQMGLMASIGVGTFFLVMYVFLPALFLGSKCRFKEFKMYDNVIRYMDLLRRSKAAFISILVVAVALSLLGFQNFSEYWYTPPGLVPESSESYRAAKLIEKEFESYGIGDIVVGVERFEDINKITQKLKDMDMFTGITSIITVLGGFSKRTVQEATMYYSVLSDIIRNPILSTILRKVGMYKQTLDMLRIIEKSSDFESVINELRKDLPMFFYEYNGKRYFLIYATYPDSLYSENNLKKVYDVLTKELNGATLLGYPALMYKIMGYMRTVVKDISLAIFLAILVIILISTRSLKVTVAMVFVMILFIASTFGVMYPLGIHVSFMTLLVIPIMTGIGVDSMIHLNHTVKKTKTALTRTEKAVSVSILTTAIAFGSFAISRGKLLQEFGVSVAIGLLLSFVFSIFLFLPMVDRRGKITETAEEGSE